MRKTGPGGHNQAAGLAVLCFLCTGGCGQNLGGDPVPDAGAGRSVEQSVMVAFVNLSTTDAVNVEFHTTSSPVANLPDDLLTIENSLSAGIGVAGTGLLVPGATDVLEVSCNENLIIGTAGGAFLDNESGEPTGRGQPRWLDATSVGLCGAIVGFTFDGRDGAFTTTVEIRRQ